MGYPPFFGADGLTQPLSHAVFAPQTTAPLVVSVDCQTPGQTVRALYLHILEFYIYTICIYIYTVSHMYRYIHICIYLYMLYNFICIYAILHIHPPHPSPK